MCTVAVGSTTTALSTTGCRALTDATTSATTSGGKSLRNARQASAQGHDRRAVAEMVERLQVGGRAGIQPGPHTPQYVEVIQRGDVTFAVNHTHQPVRVELGGSGKALVGIFHEGVAELGPYGVCAIKTVA